MKKKFNVLLLVGFMLACQSVLAQDPVWMPNPPASLSEVALGAPGTSTRTDWVNTDLFNVYQSSVTSSPGYIHATVYDYQDGGRWYSVLYVYSSISGTSLICIVDDARHPDIVIGNDHNSNVDFYALMVYEDVVNNEIHLRKFGLDDPFSSAFNLSSGCYPDPPTVISGSNNLASNPHIDMAPEDAPPVNFVVPDLYKYAITWQEQISGIRQIQLYQASLTGGTPTTATITNGTMPDLAYVYNSGLNEYIAYIVFVDAPNMELKEAEYSVTTSTTNIIQTLESSVTITAPPRIEAFNYQGGNPCTTWQAVAEVDGIYSEIHNYRDIGGMVSTTNYSTISVFDGSKTPPLSPANNPLATNHGYTPCVAAGNGPATFGSSTSIGNTDYTMGWYIDKEDYEAIAVSNHSSASANAGYVDINTTGITPGIIPAGKNYLALANGSNDGAGLVSAWYNNVSGPEVYIKYSGNAFTFKPTNVTKLFVTGAPYIYPNPANDLLNIVCEQGTDYIVTDVTGKVVTSGITKSTHETVVISDVSKGVYFVYMTKDDKTNILKFSK